MYVKHSRDTEMGAKRRKVLNQLDPVIETQHVELRRLSTSRRKSINNIVRKKFTRVRIWIAPAVRRAQYSTSQALIARAKQHPRWQHLFSESLYRTARYRPPGRKQKPWTNSPSFGGHQSCNRRVNNFHGNNWHPQSGRTKQRKTILTNPKGTDTIDESCKHALESIGVRKAMNYHRRRGIIDLPDAWKSLAWSGSVWTQSNLSLSMLSKALQWTFWMLVLWVFVVMFLCTHENYMGSHRRESIPIFFRFVPNVVP